MDIHNFKNVVVVVVNHNRKKLLLQCLSALIQQTYKPLSIYIIDNDSSDGTLDALEGYIKSGKIHYSNTGSNIGPGDSITD